MIKYDELMVMLAVVGFLGWLSPRLGWFVLMLCALAKFFGG